MDTTEITNAIDQLSDLYAARDVLLLQKQELIDTILTPEIRAAIAEIEAEFSDKASAVNTNIETLEGAIRDEVVINGKTVRGAHLQAVYNKPRVTWDSSLLEGLMIAIPQLEKARKVGQPFVSFRKVA